MNPIRHPLRLLLVAAAACPGLMAQARVAPPTPPASGLPLHQPVHARLDDGTLLTATVGYRARFAADGATFTPFQGSDAKREWPLTMRLAAAHVAAAPLPLCAAPPVRHGDVVSFDRGSVVECYELRGDGMEQSFRFETLPVRGELRLRIDVTSDLVAHSGGDGVRFAGPRGGVHYGRAVAIDAAGVRVAMTTELHDGDLELVVPAAFVADARLPLLVDPLVAPIQLFDTSNPLPLGDADYAWDDQAAEWIAVFGFNFSAITADVFGCRFGPTGAAAGPLFAIDMSPNAWRKPRIANLASAHAHLVVAEVDDGVNPTWICGRTLTNVTTQPTVGTLLTIARAGQNGAPAGAYANPDVGGDGAVSGGQWTVAFEHGAAPTRDVYLRQVASDGSLLGVVPTPVATSAYDERGPRLSKSNGYGSAATQRWGLVYERRTTTGVGDAAKLWGAIVNRDGSLRPVLGQTTWIASDNTVTGRGGFDVSSPTDDFGNGRWLLAVEARPTASQGQNLFGVLFTDVGVGGVPIDLTALENQSAATQAKNQYAPCVDCDGTRFAVGYTLDYSAVDQDVLVTTFARATNGNLVVHDGPVAVANTIAVEDEPAICSRRSGGGVPGRHLVGLHALVGAEHRLYTAIYEGLAPGGIQTRSTACGTLAFTAQGTPGLGMPLQFFLSNTAGVAGFAAGSPANAPIAPCPGCVAGTSMDVLVTGSAWYFAVPNNPAIVGLVLAVQGFDLAASGPCLGQIRVSDTADVTIR